MKTLLLMRHAKSGWEQSGPDHDRPLNARGERTAPEMGALLRREKVTPDLILSSTALRARSTALAVAEAFDWQPELRLLRDLYAAEPATLLDRVASAPDTCKCLLIVGHNPGMEDLVSDLAHMRQVMPTAAIARFDFAIEHWSDVAASTGKLVIVWRPKEIS